MLAAIKSILSGMARVLDIGATFGVRGDYLSPDYDAIKSDWQAVGDDIGAVVGAPLCQDCLEVIPCGCDRLSISLRKKQGKARAIAARKRGN